MASHSVRDQAVEALARLAVTDVAPAELPLFSASAARYRDDPRAALSPGGSGGRALGFGVETAVVLVTPFALDLVKRLFTRLAEKLGDSAADSLAGRIMRWFDAGDTSPETVAPGALSADQLRLVADVTRAEAASLQMPADQSKRLADAVIAALATRA